MYLFFLFPFVIRDICVTWMAAHTGLNFYLFVCLFLSHWTYHLFVVCSAVLYLLVNIFIKLSNWHYFVHISICLSHTRFGVVKRFELYSLSWLSCFANLIFIRIKMKLKFLNGRSTYHYLVFIVTPLKWLEKF